jgi:hypothetical protein
MTLLRPPRAFGEGQNLTAGLRLVPWALAPAALGDRNATAGVRPHAEAASKPVSRWRSPRRGPAHAAFAWLVFDPAHFIMETGALRGLKVRAKRRPLRARMSVGPNGPEVAQ